MKILTQTTLSGLKPVISGFLLLGSIFVGQCQTEVDENEGEMLKHIIEQTFDRGKEVYVLNSRATTLNDKLRRYYKTKYLNKPFMKMVIGYDKSNDTIIYASGERQKKVTAYTCQSIKL